MYRIILAILKLK